MSYGRQTFYFNIKDSKELDSDDKHKEKKQEQQEIRQWQFQAEDFLTDIIQLFSKWNKTPTHIRKHIKSFKLPVWLTQDHFLPSSHQNQKYK